MVMHDTGHLIWSTLGPKTMELVRENITAIGIKDNMAVLEADADVIEQFINDKEKSKKAAKKLEISIAAIIRGHLDNPEFISLGERLEKLRKQHEQGLLFGAAFWIQADEYHMETGSAYSCEVSKEN